MNIEQKAELYQLLQERSMTPFDRRVKRLKDTQAKLFGRDGSGSPRMIGVPEILERARKRHPLSDDEFIIANFGFTREELAALRRKTRELEHAG